MGGIVGPRTTFSKQNKRATPEKFAATTGRATATISVLSLEILM